MSGSASGVSGDVQGSVWGCPGRVRGCLGESGDVRGCLGKRLGLSRSVPSLILGCILGSLFVPKSGRFYN